MMRGDSKAALGQQRSQLRRGAKGKVHVGDAAESAAAGHAAEQAKVRHMRELLQERRKEARLRRPLAPMVAGLVLGAARLAGTLVTLPLRVVLALRGHSAAAEA